MSSLVTDDGTANSKLAREFSERKAKTYLKLNCSLSPDFSVQLNVSLSERLSSSLSQKVKSPTVSQRNDADVTHCKTVVCVCGSICCVFVVRNKLYDSFATYRANGVRALPIVARDPVDTDAEAAAVMADVTSLS